MHWTYDDANVHVFSALNRLSSDKRVKSCFIDRCNKLVQQIHCLLGMLSLLVGLWMLELPGMRNKNKLTS